MRIIIDDGFRVLTVESSGNLTVQLSAEERRMIAEMPADALGLHSEVALPDGVERGSDEAIALAAAHHDRVKASIESMGIPLEIEAPPDGKFTHRNRDGSLEKGDVGTDGP